MRGAITFARYSRECLAEIASFIRKIHPDKVD